MNTKTKKLALSLALCISMSSMVYAAPPTPPNPNALPDLGSVVAGNATVSKPNDITMNVDQTSNRVVIDWNSFNVGKDATVNFYQPGVDSIALNRVNSNEMSQIFGKINANGNIILINNNGILFGNGSQVNVAGIVASTASINISDQDFVAGKSWGYEQNVGGPNANITIQGTIIAETNGAQLQALNLTEKPVTAISSVNNKIILIADGDVVIENAGTTEVPSNLKLEAVTSTTITSTGSNIVGGEEFEVEGSASSSTALGQIIMRADANADDIAYDNDGNKKAATVVLENSSADSIQSLTTDIYYNPNITQYDKTHAQSNTAYNEKDYSNYATERDEYLNKIAQNVTKKITNADTGKNDKTESVNVTNRNVYMLINNVEQLQDISLGGANANLNGAYAQGTTIDASSTANWNNAGTGAKGFEPIGDDQSAFTGSFTGNGGIASYSINNMNINRADENNVGVFGVAKGAGFSSINMIAANIKGYDNVGAIVGSMENSSLHASSTNSVSTVDGNNQVGGLVGISTNDSKITWSTNNATVKGQKNVAGVVGSADKTTIASTTNRGNVTGNTNTGGIAGKLANESTVSASSNNRVDMGLGQFGAHIVGVTDTGGIAGHMDNSTIQGLSYNNGMINGTTNTGGLVGTMVSGKIDTSYNTNEATRLDTFVNDMDAAKSDFGRVTGIADNTGGLVGNMKNGEIINAYNAGNVTGVDNVGGLVGTMENGKITNSYNGDNNTVFYDPSIGNFFFDKTNKTDPDTYYGFEYNGEKYYCEIVTENKVVADSSKKEIWLVKGEFVFYKGSRDNKSYVHPSDLPAQELRTQNVRLAYRDANITGAENVGGAIGKMNGGAVESIYNAGTVTGNSATTGGLIGSKTAGTVAKSFNVHNDMTGKNKMSGMLDKGIGSGGDSADEVANISLQTGRKLTADKTIFGTTLGDDNTVVWSVGLDSTLPLLQQGYMTWAKINRVFEYDGSVHNLKTEDVANLYGNSNFKYEENRKPGDYIAGKDVYNGIAGSDTNDKYKGSTVNYYEESNLWSPQHGYYMTSDSSIIITPKKLVIDVSGNKTYGDDAVKDYIYEDKDGKLVDKNGHIVTDSTGKYLVTNDAGKNNVSGFVNGESFEVLGDKEKLTHNGNKIGDDFQYSKDSNKLDAGSYDLMKKEDGALSGLTADHNNYTIEYKGTLTVDKAKLTISGEKDYDGNNKLASDKINISGFVNGETVGLTGNGTLISKDVADYGDQYKDLDHSGLTIANGTNGGKASNYEISTATGKVNAKEIDITTSKEYDGNANIAGSEFGSINTGVGNESITIAGQGQLASQNVNDYGGIAQDLAIKGDLSTANGTNGGVGSNYKIGTATGKVTPKDLTINIYGENYYNNYANNGYQIGGNKPNPGKGYHVNSEGLIAGETLDGATDIGTAWGSGGNDGYKYSGDGYQKGTLVGEYGAKDNYNPNGLAANNGNYNIKYTGNFKIIKAEFYYVADQTTYLQGLPIYKQTGKVVDVYGNIIDTNILVDNNGEFTTDAIQGSPVGKYHVYGQGNKADDNGRPMWESGVSGKEPNYTIVQVAANDTALTIIPNDTYQTEVGNNAGVFGGQIERIGAGSVRYLSMQDNGINTDMMRMGVMKLKANKDGTFVLDEPKDEQK